ncbi:ankyrin repeat domain-containing protein [Candidatus Pacearchaeota archaeon]|jgi:ankyrin repeat protein|nr:ankyrin repeat domain-containing protein [Candidatus Pacearchaeota archaeon]
MTLIDAISINDLQQVKECIENGADIHAHDEYALKYAAMYGYLNIVKYLVEHGADIYALDNYTLKWATYFEHFDVIKYLISLYNKEELRKYFSQFNFFYIKYLILERLYDKPQ